MYIYHLPLENHERPPNLAKLVKVRPMWGVTTHHQRIDAPELQDGRIRSWSENSDFVTVMGFDEHSFRWMMLLIR
jgi:hypothetical protein